MGNKNRKKKKNNIKIPKPILQDEPIKFSFKFYDLSDNGYCLSKWESCKLKKAMIRLREISEKTLNELMKDRAVLHFFPVYWEQTIKKNGFPDAAANNLDPYHFGLLGVNGQLTRIYGALSKNTFYIVWFDLNHAIWPTPKKNT